MRIEGKNEQKRAENKRNRHFNGKTQSFALFLNLTETADGIASSHLNLHQKTTRKWSP